MNYFLLHEKTTINQRLFILDRDEFEEEQSTPVASSKTTNEPILEQPPPQESSEDLPSTEDLPSDTGQTNKTKSEENTPAPTLSQNEIPVSNIDPHLQQPQSLAPRQPFRQKFQRWPNQQQPPRWNNVPLHQQQMPFQRGPVLRSPAHNMMQGNPGPQRQMRPGGFPLRPPFFNNNFMQSRAPMRPPMVRQRFFYQNQPPIGDPSMQGHPAYIPAPLMGSANPAPAMLRKVLINPNFKGGVEAAKSNLFE